MVSELIPTKTRNYINEKILDKVISETTPAKGVDVSGFRRYSILARFEGPADATFKLEVNNNKMLVAQEVLKLNSGGWLNFAKEYIVYGPQVGVVIYHTPKNLEVQMSLYAGL